MGDLVEAFVAATEDENPKLHKQLSRLADNARAPLAALLARFDYTHTGDLDADERKLAQRVLGMIHTPSAKGYELLVQVFDYMDVNDSQTLEHRELTLAIEVLDLFTKADSVNDTLSSKELELLLSVLGKLDADGNGVLDPGERVALRDGLWDPDAFLAEHVG
jgi:hypothetical protein